MQQFPVRRAGKLFSLYTQTVFPGADLLSLTYSLKAQMSECSPQDYTNFNIELGMTLCNMWKQRMYMAWTLCWI